MQLKYRIISLFFLGVIAVNVVFPSFLVAVVSTIGNDSIEQYCENKTDVALDCHGKCYLTKKLIQVEQTDDKTSSPILLEVKELLLIYTVTEPITIVSDFEIKNHTIQPFSHEMKGFASLVFHPPLA